jgi:hypothetical protein
MNKYLEKIAGLNLEIVKGFSRKPLQEKAQQYTGRFGRFIHQGVSNQKNLMADVAPMIRNKVRE